MARGKSNTSSEILEFALKHMISERDAIQARIEAVRARLGSPRQGRAAQVLHISETPVQPAKRNLSDAARQRIADAQRRRWAKARKSSAATA